MMSARVSVVMSVYNGQRHLRQAYLAQAFLRKSANVHLTEVDRATFDEARRLDQTENR